MIMKNIAWIILLIILLAPFLVFAQHGEAGQSKKWSDLAFISVELMLIFLLGVLGGLGNALIESKEGDPNWIPNHSYQFKTYESIT